MTREEAFAEINKIQDEYVDELISLMNNSDCACMKVINFTSPTGTGKTKMMSKLINKLPQYYFIITTLSKGQLHFQVRSNLESDCNQQNFFVYGSADYRINSKLEAEDIIGRIPEGMPCIWLRDEGHIATNRFDQLLQDVCYKVINISATNIRSDIQCNFTQTMMLRTVNQQPGTPEDAIKKLKEIKASHAGVSNYNPCAIFRCVSGNDDLYEMIVKLCKKYHLNYIDISEDSFVMAQLCEDDDEHDVIINKFKIVEGIDIRRAHVLYMDNQPSSNATTIQVIGRCRRNALLYRNDIDILAPENKELLDDTRECYVYYNVKDMKIDSDVNGELYYAFCDRISCEALKVGSTIEVDNGQLSNGLKVVELSGQTGKFVIERDPDTGFNVVSPLTSFYDTSVKKCSEYVYIKSMKTVENQYGRLEFLRQYRKIHIDDVAKLSPHRQSRFDYSVGKQIQINDAIYFIEEKVNVLDYDASQLNFVSNIDYLDKQIRKFTKEWISEHLQYHTVEFLSNFGDGSLSSSCEYYRKELADFREKYNNKYVARFYNEILNFNQKTVEKVTSTGFRNLVINDIMCDNSQIVLSYWFLQDVKNVLLNMKKDETTYDLKSIDFLFRQWKQHINMIMTIICSANLDKNDESHIDNLVMNCIHMPNTIHYVYNIDEFIALVNSDDFRYAFPYIETECTYNKKITMSKKDIDRYVSRVTNFSSFGHYFITFGVDLDQMVDCILDRIRNSRDKLASGIIELATIDYSTLFQNVSNDEVVRLDNKELMVTNHLTASELQRLKSYTYNKIINDKESSIVGFDVMRPIKIDNCMTWIESSSVSSKVGKYNKLNTFISNRYSLELEVGKNQCFTGKNTFDLDKKCNSAIGYCVEYYSKYLVYGEEYLGRFLDEACREAKCSELNDYLIVRACMLKYRAMMIRSFGSAVSRLIQTMSITTLIQKKYQYFVRLVIALGTQTAEYVRQELYSDRPAVDNVDPDLSIRHITGLADYITTDAILDVKVRNCIDEKCIRQVLAYHYLSTKRSDLNIKRVIVYDAVSNRAVTIDISPENMKKDIFSE